MQTTSGRRNGNKKYAAFGALLQKQREVLTRKLNQRLDEVVVQSEPDDDAGLATLSFTTDLALSTLERERRELGEIESALARIKANEYGICQNCGNPIAEARLRALPWARWCIKCAARILDAGMAAD